MGVMKKLTFCFLCLVFSACTFKVPPEKLESLSFYLHDRFVYDPASTDRFMREYLKDCSGRWDVGTYAPPAFTFRNKHVTIYFYRDTIITIVHSELSQFRRSTTGAERCIYDEFECKYLRQRNVR